MCQGMTMVVFVCVLFQGLLVCFNSPSGLVGSDNVKTPR